MTRDNSVLVPWKPIPAVDPQFRYHAPHVSWADPSVEAAAEALHRLRTDKDLYDRLSNAALTTAREAFAAERYRSAVESALPPPQ